MNGAVCAMSDTIVDEATERERERESRMTSDSQNTSLIVVIV